MTNLKANTYEIKISTNLGELIVEGRARNKDELKHAIMKRFCLYDVKILDVILKEEVMYI